MPAPRFAFRLGWRSLQKVVPILTNAQARQLARDLGQAMHEFNINTPSRAAFFVSQTAHESGGFRYREEIADGSAYEGQRDLGNIHKGDGTRFKGRTYIQITGRANYEAISKALGFDFVNHPAKLAEPKYAALGAAWWWAGHRLNRVADRGTDAAFVDATRIINGGTTGLADRQLYYSRAKKVAPYLVPKRRPPT